MLISPQSTSMLISQGDSTNSIFILTVNYYCSDLVSSLFESVADQDVGNVYYVIVDNSMHDPGLDALATQPGTTVIRAERNLGFGSGCNLGLDYIESISPSAMVWLLNPDATLLPGAMLRIKSLIKNMRPRVAVIGTQIIASDGTPWFISGSFDRLSGSFDDTSIKPPASNASNSPLAQPTDWVSGCSMLINLSAFSTPPRFDPNIFLYYEDAELCLRLRKHGFMIYVTAEPLVKHLVSATTSKQPRRMRRFSTFGKLYVILRHGTLMALLINVIYLPAKLAVSLRPLGEIIGCLEGIQDFVIWLTNALRRKLASGN